MNGLRKSVLAIAVAALPFAVQAEIKVLDDSAMSAVTGQAGVSIELQTKIDIGQFRYTDEGSFRVSDISIGGTGTATSTYFGVNWGPGARSGDLLDDILINIDIASDGDAIINMLPANLGNAVDFKVTTGDWELVSQDGTENTLLVSSFNLEGLAFGMSARIDTSTDTMRILADFAVADMDVEVDFLAVGLKDIQITGAGYDSAAPRLLDVPTTLDVTLGKRANRNGVDSLAVDIADWTFDMSIGAVEIGGTSIGSVVLDNVTVANTSMIVYGH